MRMRCFFAIELEEAIRTQIQKQIAPLKSNRSFRWVKSSHIHLTLRFLGDVEDTKIKKIEAAAQSKLQAIQRFGMTLGGLGGFPRLERARVLWLALDEGVMELIALKGAIDETLFPLGFMREGKAYTPHLTLARSRSSRPSSFQPPSTDLFPERFLPMIIKEIVLMKSDLATGTPVYTPLFKVPLQAR